MSSPGTGTVETAYRSWVKTLGPLSPLQQAEAETLYRLAAQLDLDTERPASALGTLRRAISTTVDRLREEKESRSSTGQPSPDPSVVVAADVVAAARALREERRNAGSS